MDNLLLGWNGQMIGLMVLFSPAVSDAVASTHCQFMNSSVIFPLIPQTPPSSCLPANLHFLPPPARRRESQKWWEGHFSSGLSACFPLHLFKKTKEAEYGGYRLWSTRWSEHLAEGKGLAALQWLLICHSCCDSTAYLSFLKGFYFWMPSSSRMYLVIILPDS